MASLWWVPLLERRLEEATGKGGSYRRALVVELMSAFYLGAALGGPPAINLRYWAQLESSCR